jgi:hypothetical protein
MTFQRYQRCRRKQGVVLRSGNKAGEKLFVLRTTTPIYNPSGGPVKQAHPFVATLEISRSFLFDKSVIFDVLRRNHNRELLQFFH